MATWVQVCTSNPMARRTDLLDTLVRLRGDCRLELVSCLDECTACEHAPCALVNGRVLKAATCEQLAEAIRREVGLPGTPVGGQRED